MAIYPFRRPQVPQGSRGASKVRKLTRRDRRAASRKDSRKKQIMPPRPTPTAVLASRGSWRAQTRSDEPTPTMPDLDELTPPLDLPARALDIWRGLASRLFAAGLLTTADLPTFERYCRAYAAWDEAMRVVERDGPERQNVLTLAKLSEELRKLEDGFGLTPAARTGIRTEPAQHSGKSRFFVDVETRSN